MFILSMRSYSSTVKFSIFVLDETPALLTSMSICPYIECIFLKHSLTLNSSLKLG